MSPQEALEKFLSYEASFTAYHQTDLNETETRSKIIDVLFKDVLGWAENDIRREEYTGNGFYDYKFGVPVFSFVVEAKRNLRDIILPSGFRKTSLRLLLKGNEELLIQIRNYLVDVGLTHGVATNGRQFIIAQFVNTNGKPWQDNEALVFDGMESIKENFIQFYNNLSRPAIINNGGFHFLYQPAAQGSNLLHSAIDKDREITRNTISSKLAALIDGIFGDIFNDGIEDDIEFIKECFVENSDTRKNREEIERLFGDHPPKLAEVIPAQNVDSINEQVSDEIGLWKDLNRDRAPQPIILVGSKGVGKTTFINYLIKHRLDHRIKESNIFVYLDFRKYYDNAIRFEESEIASDAINILVENFESLKLQSLETLKLVYQRQIEYNHQNIWRHLDKESSEYSERLSTFIENRLDDSVRHLEKLCLFLLYNQSRRVVLVFDNCDQFDEDLQKKVFIFSHALHRNAKCGIILSLREGYYYRWRVQKPFDAYNSNVYHLSTPRYGRILQKRIDYTLKKLEQKDKNVRGEISSGAHLTIGIDKVSRFLDSLNQSLFHSTNNEILDFLNYTTYPNIREGLSIFKNYLTSGHTNVEEILLRHGTDDRMRRPNVIPLHEFIKAVALHNHVYYQNDLSIVKNLYYPEVDSDNHLIKIRVLQYMDELREQSGDDRFRTVGQMLDFFSALGYRRSDIKNALDTLFSWRLIDSRDILSDVDSQKSVPDDCMLGISSKGFYYLRSLCFRFTYLDLCLQDVPIYDLGVFESLARIFPASDDKGKRPLDRRMECVRIFVEYLKVIANKEARAVTLRLGDFINDVLVPRINTDLEMLTNRLNRNL